MPGEDEVRKTTTVENQEQPHGANPRLNTIHLVFKTHLDIGFTDLAEKITSQYFEHFIPAAIDTAESFQQIDTDDSYIWTTGSWLIYEYLERSSHSARRRLEQAIETGHIRWHGLPFTSHSELMDTSLFEFGLDLSHRLDKRFGKKTISGKMTDVPGHSIAIVPSLARYGIEFLHIGVNSVCRSPDVPPIFIWRAPAGEEVVVMYHDNYGGTRTLPGTSSALRIVHSTDESGNQDNLGPHTYKQAQKIYRETREQFPGSLVKASTLDDIAEEIQTIRSELPVVEDEIGDTWIHGIASDPVKTSQFRELNRLRQGWAPESLDDTEKERFDEFSRFMLLVPEHTWGMDVKKFLPGDTSYSQKDFIKARSGSAYKRIEKSWEEQRNYLDKAVNALGNTSMAYQAQKALADFAPNLPSFEGLEHIYGEQRDFETDQFQITFDRKTGSIINLQAHNSGIQWATPENEIGLYRYQTFSQSDYDRFLSQYHTNTQDWAIPDFSKPGIRDAGAEGRYWLPDSAQLYAGSDSNGWRFINVLAMPQEVTDKYGCPKTVIVETVVPNATQVLNIRIILTAKSATRLPEASWYTVNPFLERPDLWLMDKMGLSISPNDVIAGGNRNLHAVQEGLVCGDGNRRIKIETLDAPLVAPGEPSLLNFSDMLPRLDHGMHFNLHNNVWGTNFPMWYEDDSLFRFNLHFGSDE